MEIEGHCESITGRHPPGFKSKGESDKRGGNEVADSNGKVMHFDFYFQDGVQFKLVGD